MDTFFICLFIAYALLMLMSYRTATSPHSEEITKAFPAESHLQRGKMIINYSGTAFLGFTAIIGTLYILFK